MSLLLAVLFPVPFLIISNLVLAFFILSWLFCWAIYPDRNLSWLICFLLTLSVYVWTRDGLPHCASLYTYWPWIIVALSYWLESAYWTFSTIMLWLLPSWIFWVLSKPSYLTPDLNSRSFMSKLKEMVPRQILECSLLLISLHCV